MQRKLWSDVWMPKSRNEMFCSMLPLFWETCSNVMELSELINENDFDDEPPTLTPFLLQFSHWAVCRCLRRSRATTISKSYGEQPQRERFDNVIARPSRLPQSADGLCKCLMRYGFWLRGRHGANGARHDNSQTELLSRRYAYLLISVFRKAIPKKGITFVNVKADERRARRRRPRRGFVSEPPRRVDFTNNTGAVLSCLADGVYQRLPLTNAVVVKGRMDVRKKVEVVHICVARFPFKVISRFTSHLLAILNDDLMNNGIRTEPLRTSGERDASRPPRAVESS
ncbi:hypothetical protein EVAR_84028_1 [Eumeta japonica]|uniref:Uncharacterized protein n=1 Tax=Eumeta variegata TaxID=151549 RepID=A0A4C1X6N7_EUMVA|nr:hypothetical protein EVAR_84028_1 [Eumeta japonica]